jgi:hypothetical protein
MHQPRGPRRPAQRRQQQASSCQHNVAFRQVPLRRLCDQPRWPGHNCSVERANAAARNRGPAAACVASECVLVCSPRARAYSSAIVCSLRAVCTPFAPHRVAQARLSAAQRSPAGRRGGAARQGLGLIGRLEPRRMRCVCIFGMAFHVAPDALLFKSSRRFPAHRQSLAMEQVQHAVHRARSGRSSALLQAGEEAHSVWESSCSSRVGAACPRACTLLHAWFHDCFEGLVGAAGAVWCALLGP